MPSVPVTTTRRWALCWLICAVLFGLAPAASAVAQTGLDPAFGREGFVTTPLRATAMSAALVLQPDGKVVAAGTTAGPDAFGLVRYNADGTTDRSFGVDGLATGPAGWVAGVLRQADGRLLVVGTEAQSTSLAIVRFDPDGSLDHTYGADGVARMPLDSFGGSPYSMALQPDNKLVVAGIASHPNEMFLVRFDNRGTPDPTFGTGGRVSTRAGRESVGLGMALQPDGRIILVGSTTPQAGSVEQVSAAVRYETDGTLDETFGDGGLVTGSPSGGLNGQATLVALQPDGKILMGASVGAIASLARYRLDGTIDRTFGTDGVAHLPGLTVATGLAVRPDGTIVVDGFTNTPQGYQFRLGRYTATGALDVSFGSNGTVVAVPNPRPAPNSGWTCPTVECIHALVVQPDGRIITAQVLDFPGSRQQLLIRYQADGGAVAAAPTTTTTTTTTTSDVVAGPQPSAPADSPQVKPSVEESVNLPIAGATLPVTGSDLPRRLAPLGAGLVIAGLLVLLTSGDALRRSRPPG